MCFLFFFFGWVFPQVVYIMANMWVYIISIIIIICCMAIIIIMVVPLWLQAVVLALAWAAAASLAAVQVALHHRQCSKICTRKTPYEMAAMWWSAHVHRQRKFCLLIFVLKKSIDTYVVFKIMANLQICTHYIFGKDA